MKEKVVCHAHDLYVGLFLAAVGAAVLTLCGAIVISLVAGTPGM